ncbi:MAG: carbamoyltransferase HypF [Elusimicrobiales bacterium]|nr:carbamoyltransferase HypF [Elusimicrobiales bacterium]
MQRKIRKKITVTGIVQGVGFRPFIYRVAGENGVSGWVSNTSGGVVIEAEASAAALEKFIAEITSAAPPQSRVDSVSTEDIVPQGLSGFEIRQSLSRAENSAIIPADLAVCGDCARELADPADRRYDYPFINCTNCGPRFTIVKTLPYDRASTTMSAFRLCPDCKAEFEDPSNRRFHAQPNACPVCGPGARLDGYAGPRPLAEAARLLAGGSIVAVKSLGGFQFACGALDNEAVGRLRAAKRRPFKPLAVMMADMETVRRYCAVSEEEERLLRSAPAPAVMLKKSVPGALPLAAPGLDTLGVMLPYTPLHRVLFSELAALGFNEPLVMTSANLRDEPIAISAESFAGGLSGIAAAVLDHNREIHNRCDDSVAFCSAGKTRLVRRARGWVPGGIKLPRGGPCVLGAGGQMKGAFCLTRGAEAFLSQHIGEMDEPESDNFYRESLAKLSALLGARPETAACDLHPDYAATRIAKSLGLKIAEVQHHFAHIASVLAEHGLEEPAIGIAFDGSGLGPDKTVWGGEILLTDGAKWERAGSLRSARLPGGDAAAVEIWRMGLSWLREVFGENWRDKAPQIFARMEPAPAETVEKMVLSGFNSPHTTSMGRLFDAVSFICGGPAVVTYEAQAAMEFEAAALARAEGGWRFDVYKEGGLWIMDPAPVIRAAAAGGLAAGSASRKFHSAVYRAALAAATGISAETGIKKISLSGGVFQNALLLKLFEEGFARAGFAVYSNLQAPSNDGGLALGQAWAALKTL